MSAFDPNIPDPDPKPLADVAYALAARIGKLVERTLNLYETHLEKAEAHAAEQRDAAPESAFEIIAEYPAPTERPAAPRASTAPRPHTPREPHIPTGAIAQLYAVNRLVRAMESLLRIAAKARELESLDEIPPQYAHDREAMKQQIMGEIYSNALQKLLAEEEREIEEEEARREGRELPPEPEDTEDPYAPPRKRFTPQAAHQYNTRYNNPLNDPNSPHYTPPKNHEPP